MKYDLILPSKPKVVKEDGIVGIYEIDGLSPGYGHTLGNSLRRIILSSLPGAAITKVKIKGVDHEFSVINGVKEDVITILLNIKKLRVRIDTDEPQNLRIKVKGISSIDAKDIEAPGQVEILNKDQNIATLTEKSSELDIEMTAEKGLGYVQKEILQKERVDIGSITLDAAFTPIRKANYEVENMRVGDRTDYNRLRVMIETDGSITPREALERSIEIMINQLKSIIGFREGDEKTGETESEKELAKSKRESNKAKNELGADLLKTRIDSMDLSSRTTKALAGANIHTLGGLSRKKEADIMDVDGLGAKGMQEIKKLLAQYSITLRQ
ncbi:MAG: DNA-directed RNA polymerase subunit alpha [Candidatus Paceibacterota bacterium]|jgi:DNA-directed RNA polymerase subunit alpha